ncbi:MAG: hypothetical protein ACPLXC_00935 [Candidatus Pacearchaeota archaeon]
MKQSKNLNFNNKNNGQIFLEEFVLFCIDESIRISMNGGDLDKLEDKLCKLYNLERDAAIRMYSPVFYYLTCDLKTRIIDCDCTLKYTRWYASEKAKNLLEEEKKKMIKNIIKNNEEYYKAIISKFNLNTWLL